MKRLFTILLTILFFCAPACTKYKSRYNAVALVRTNTKTEFSASFGSLDGTLVGKIQSPTAKDGALYCKATLTQGEMTVYYDWGFDKEFLFTLKAEESIDKALGYYSNGARVYIIVEASAASEGNFSITV